MNRRSESANHDRDTRPDLSEIVEANRETFETVAERDDRWGKLARRALREAGVEGGSSADSTGGENEAETPEATGGTDDKLTGKIMARSDRFDLGTLDEMNPAVKRGLLAELLEADREHDD
jgi:hypothetical protein